MIVSDLEDHEDILSLILNFKRLREPFFVKFSAYENRFSFVMLSGTQLIVVVVGCCCIES